MRVSTALCFLVVSTSDAKRLGSATVEEEGHFSVSDVPQEFDIPEEPEVADRRLVISPSKEAKSRSVEDGLILVEGGLLFGDELVHDEDGRALQSCPDGKERWVFEMTTDNYAFESSWELDYELNGSDGMIVSGPPAGHRYQDDTVYSGAMCLSPGTYTLVVRDNQGDGLCCQYGSGSYTSTIGGELVGDGGNGVDFNVRTHNFSVGGGGGGGGDGRNGCHDVTVQMKVDNYGMETSWYLRRHGNIVLSSVREVPSNEMIEKTDCLLPDDYVLEVVDDSNDGICCQYGDGYYRVIVDGTTIVNGGRIPGVPSKTHAIKIGYQPTMDDTDRKWLDAHNEIRREKHEEFNKSFVPLRWSESLAAEAQEWANTLLDDCDTKGLWHEPNIPEGENLAGSIGTGTWADKIPEVNIVKLRWVENEINWGWPRNAHLTQALWRSSQYVGCGESVKEYPGSSSGKKCRRQVCRYVTSGNCNMGSGEDYWDKVNQDQSRCMGECPSEGCYA